MTNFVIGDIHGRYTALKEVLKKSKFDYENDKLIVLGDIVDGGSETKEVIDELLKIKNKIIILGNHDEWALEWMKTGEINYSWYSQGGEATYYSYGQSHLNVPKSHIKLLENAKSFYKDKQNNLFVHGGFNPDIDFIENTKDTLLWNRNIIAYARTKPIPKWNKVFIGHTTTQNINGETKPAKLHNLYCLDTGAGYDGKLTIMNIDTEQYFQSKTQKGYTVPITNKNI